MNAVNPNLSVLRPTAFCAAALAILIGSPVAAKKLPAPSTDDQAVVECQLPPQIRTLGNHATYLAAGQRVSTTIADCKVRGGKYDGHGPGAFAGQASASLPAGAVAVTVGGDHARPGCPKSGVVGGLKASGGLSVRLAPGATAGRVDKLGNGKHVFMCDWSGNGAWVGVVYPGTSGVDCGVSATIDHPQPYSGACRSGWVSSKYVRATVR